MFLIEETVFWGVLEGAATGVFPLQPQLILDFSHFFSLLDHISDTHHI
jgi:hypothetical protein